MVAKPRPPVFSTPSKYVTPVKRKNSVVASKTQRSVSIKSVDTRIKKESKKPKIESSRHVRASSNLSTYRNKEV